ncbi:thiolase family protein [Demequina sp. NBRC 110056]|uniref:thiolase family protein n=1 Tax=Demequina sp. NBRC 110056 TaxID=1570345 RepID=UPI0009FF096D|nr:thiolase family protein [Demequina sp. NBRC 110056]
MSTAPVIYDAVRTPFGRHGRGLAQVRPDDLAATVIGAIVERSGLDPASIDDVIMGDANQAGEDNRDVARFGALLAGLPTSVPGTTVNRLCGSSLDAIIHASRAVIAEDASLVVAGGVESMTRAPFVLEKSPRAFPAANQTLWSTSIGWRMVNPRFPAEWSISNGESAERLASIYGISREDQDAFAVRSHRLAALAWDEGVFDDEIVQIAEHPLPRDESIRPDSSSEALATLSPAFAADGTVTAGNSSPLSDGASAILVGAPGALDVEPLATITGRGVAGNDPDVFGVAPVEAANRALARAGRTWDDVDVVELNEAFASQSLACLRLWPDLDPERLNVHGGAIAIGHPLGASGARIVGRAAHHLASRGGGVAVAAICIGVGQGLAVVIER